MTSSTLRHHMTAIHGSSSDKSALTCPVCSKVFTMPSSMRKHMRVHRPDETHYTCPHESCKRGFNDPSSYAKHLRTHNGGCILIEHFLSFLMVNDLILTIFNSRQMFESHEYHLSQVITCGLQVFQIHWHVY